MVAKSMKGDRRMKRVVAACTLTTSLAILSLGVRCGGETEVVDPPSPPASTIELRGTVAGTPIAAYDLCVRDERPADRSAGVQVFLDASGSTRGFSVASVMSPLAQWVKRASIGSPTSGVELSLTRLQAFSTDGFIDLPTREETVTYEVGHGNTNLDEVIARAQDEAITVIATDGVPYTTGLQSAACAGQVDVTCVAKKLREFIDANPHPGMWIVPLFGRYDGKYAAEGQRIPNNPEWAEQTTRQLKETLGGDIRLRANDSADRATNPFFYTGPRTLLLIVLAKDASMGRIFLSSLYERASQYRVALLGEDFTAFNGMADHPLGAFTPVELYPGYTPRISSIRGEKRKAPANLSDEAGGFISVKELREGNPFQAQVACAGARESTPDQVIDLAFSTGAHDRCRKMYSLPSVQYLPELPVKTGDSEKKDASTLVRKLVLTQATAEQNGALRGEMHIRCAGGGRGCDNPSTIRIVAKVAYSDAAERLADRTGSVGAVAYLQRLSTESLVEEPFKVLALDRMLIEVMRTITQDAAAQDVGRIDVCRTDPTPPVATATHTSDTR
jgi:hypothetical protein